MGQWLPYSLPLQRSATLGLRRVPELASHINNSFCTSGFPKKDGSIPGKDTDLIEVTFT